MRFALGIFTLLILAGCKTTSGIYSETRTLCNILEPIYYSKADTELTKKQARELNAIGVKLCGWKGKAK